MLLLCVKRIIHSDVKYLRLLAASFSGAVFSIAAFLPFNHFPVNLLLDIIFSAVITLICFGYKNRKYFIKAASTLIIITMLFSGAMIFLYLAFKPDGMAIINNTVYFNISPIALILLTVIIYTLLFFFRRIYNNHTHTNELHKVKFRIDDKIYELQCKRDSGCNVREPFSGSGVIIIQADALDGLSVNRENFRLIPFKSLCGDGLLRGIKGSEITIDGKTLNEEVYIGLYKGNFQNEIKGLIPDNLLKD